jgi:recombinational DNA repair protein RecT
MKDAKAAGLDGKDVWKKYPRNMLFGRAMTNGCRWYCPDIFGGKSVYTPEELNADFSLEPSGAVVGYAAYFQLHNGYEKLVYWTKKQAEEHGRRFSQSFNNGPWKSDFDAMAMKTVLKNTLSKWGILSIEMQTAVRTDSAVIKDENGTVVQYVDNADAVEQLPLITEEQLEQAKKEIIEGNCYLEDVTALYDLYPEQIEYLKN